MRKEFARFLGERGDRLKKRQSDNSQPTGNEEICEQRTKRFSDRK